MTPLAEDSPCAPAGARVKAGASGYAAREETHFHKEEPARNRSSLPVPEVGEGGTLYVNRGLPPFHTVVSAMEQILLFVKTSKWHLSLILA